MLYSMSLQERGAGRGRSLQGVRAEHLQARANTPEWSANKKRAANHVAAGTPREATCRNSLIGGIPAEERQQPAVQHLPFAQASAHRQILMLVMFFEQPAGHSTESVAR